MGLCEVSKQTYLLNIYNIVSYSILIIYTNFISYVAFFHILNEYYDESSIIIAA